MRFFTGMRTDTGSLDEVGRAPILDEGKAAHVAVAAYLVLVEATCGLGVRQVCDRPGSILALRQVVRRGRQADCPPAARGRGEPDPDGARSLRARAARGSQAGRRRGRALVLVPSGLWTAVNGALRPGVEALAAHLVSAGSRRGLRSASAILQLATSAPIVTEALKQQRLRARVLDWKEERPRGRGGQETRTVPKSGHSMNKPKKPPGYVHASLTGRRSALWPSALALARVPPHSATDPP